MDIELEEGDLKMIINPSISKDVERFPDGGRGIMFSVDDLFMPTEEDIKRITWICNQPIVYERLFKERLKGEPYSEESARGFIDWAKQGWREQKYFVFLVRNPKNQISCSVDIKSDNLDDAEVGYWASPDSPGLMTNAVVQLCEIAKNAGYKQLHAKIAQDNQRSTGVITRAGFNLSKEYEKKDKDYRIYTKVL